MRQILEEKGGEDAEVVFNFSNSIHPLVSQVSALQNDKVKLTEKNLSIEYQLNESKNKVNELKQQMENEYVSLDEFKLLQLEKEYLQKNKVKKKHIKNIALGLMLLEGSCTEVSESANFKIK